MALVEGQSPRGEKPTHKKLKSKSEGLAFELMSLALYSRVYIVVAVYQFLFTEKWLWPMQIIIFECGLFIGSLAIHHVVFQFIWL